MSAIERAGPDGNWLKVDVEKLGIKYLPISKDGEILFESVLPRLPSEGSRNRLRDRVMSVGSSIGAVTLVADAAASGGDGCIVAKTRLDVRQ